MEPDTNPPPPAELQAQPVLLRATIQITRAATGLVEEYELTGVLAQPEPPKEG